MEKIDFEIHRHADKLSATADAGEHLNNILAENKKRPILLMLSAGSCLEILDYISISSLGENITVSMLDERFSTDTTINNFAQMQKLDFYKEALDAECSFFGTVPRAAETQEGLRQRWQANLKNWQEQNPDGLIVATLGMAADGHTAGIFADDDEKKFNELFSNDNWIVAYSVGNKHKYSERVTTTLTFLKLIDFGIAYVVGEEKKEKFYELIANQGKINQLPALVWHEVENVKVFTDIK